MVVYAVATDDDVRRADLVQKLLAGGMRHRHRRCPLPPQREANDATATARTDRHSCNNRRLEPQIPSSLVIESN